MVCSSLVTLGDALAELGIVVGTGTEPARRAYLRLLKTRTPEKDPAGFRRLREAYEIVRAMGSRTRLLLPTHVVTVGPAGDVALPGEGAPGEPTLELHAPVEPGAKGGSTVEEHLHNEFIVLAPIGALREALARGDHSGGARRMTSIYTDAARNLDAPAPPAQVALDLMLALYAAGLLEEAYALDHAFRAWLEAGGREVRILGGLCAPWGLLRELRALPPELSPPVRAIIAAAIRSGKVKEARVALHQLSFRNPAAAVDGHLLRRHGGRFCKALADDLHWAGAVPATREVRRSTTRWVVLAPVVAAAFGGILAIGSASSPSDAARIYGPPPVTRHATTVADSFVDEAERLGASAIAERGRGIYGALMTGDCSTARYHAERLDDQTRPPELAGSLRALRRSLDTVCPPESGP